MVKSVVKKTSSESSCLKVLDFLRDPFVASLIAQHPNDVTSLSFTPPTLWKPWWDLPLTSGSSQSNGECSLWKTIVQAYVGEGSNQCMLPKELESFISRARGLDLDRSPRDRDIPANVGNRSTPGMSPKKAHEVSRMVNYVKDLVQSSASLQDIRHIVDVGAGQGYLSRAFCDLGFHVLALDSSDVQTQGAERWREWDRKGKSRSFATNQDSDTYPSSYMANITGNTTQKPIGTLTHKTVYIDPSTLNNAITSWLEESTDTQDRSTHANPVLLVALHACGSLTPSILKTFVSLSSRGSSINASPSSSVRWEPRAAVIVGCCYNMMAAEDFPLSKTVANASVPSFNLTASHLQLAAQTPLHWLDTPSASSITELAVRKVAFRALLQRHLHEDVETDNSIAREQERKPTSVKRLGRLPDSAYASFETFITRAAQRLDMDPSDLMRPTFMSDPKEVSQLTARVELLHVLRCLTGPAIESLIIEDRFLWLKDSLQSVNSNHDTRKPISGEERWTVELVALFDQALGSARNLALVVVPRGGTPDQDNLEYNKS